MNNNDGITTVKIYKVRKEKVAHTEIIKTIKTSKEEIKINNRARSAKLRIAEKI